MGRLGLLTATCRFVPRRDAAAIGVTCWFMLLWRDLDEDKRILLGRGLREIPPAAIAVGAIPPYFRPTSPAAGWKAHDRLSGVLAKTAADQRSGTREAALAAGRFVDRHVLQARLLRLETFYSCSPKPLDWIDPVCGIRPQTTSPSSGLRSFLELHRLTGSLTGCARRVRARPALVVPAGWSPPTAKGLPVRRVRVMNTDGEWNDGRSSRFMPTYARYYKAASNTYLRRASPGARKFAHGHPEPDNGISLIRVGRAPMAVPAGRGYAPEGCCTAPAAGAVDGFNGTRGGLAATYLARFERRGSTGAPAGRAHRRATADRPGRQSHRPRASSALARRAPFTGSGTLVKFGNMRW